MDKIFVLKTGKDEGLLLNPFNMKVAAIINPDKIEPKELNKDDLLLDFIIQGKQISIIELAQIIRRGNLFTKVIYKGEPLRIIDLIRDNKFNTDILTINGNKLYIKTNTNRDIKILRKPLTIKSFAEIYIYEQNKELPNNLIQFMKGESA